MPPARFFRMNTDRTRSDVPLDGLFAGPFRSACWLIGGGPSLSQLRVREIAASPLPKMCINLAGSRIIRPTFWTSYDPSVRFHRSTYLDASVMKFVHRCRAMDFVPETNFKVCESPNLYFFERDSKRGFTDIFRDDGCITDWADSMVQAIEILYRLGFRIIYLAGCEMRIRPSHAQIEYAVHRDVRYRPGSPLRDFLQDCDRAGIRTEELDRLGPGRQYHFAEWRPIRSAANTDYHYFRVAQWLRLSRRSFSLAGLDLISVTPHSRLNDYFPYRPIRRVLQGIRQEIGDPQTERVTGLYSESATRTPPGLGLMRDFRPHGWPREKKPPPRMNPNPALTRMVAVPLPGSPEIIAEHEQLEPVPEPAHHFNGQLAKVNH